MSLLFLGALLAAAPTQCTPEHAAMGHCKLAPAPKPKAARKSAPRPKPVAKPRPRPKATAAPTRPLARPATSPPAPQSPVPLSTAAPDCPSEHAAMGHCKPSSTVSDSPAPAAGPPPALATSDPEHAADAIWGAGTMAYARHAVHAEHGDFRGHKLLLDRLEYRATNGRNGYAWEGEAWFGGDYDKLWLKTEGEGEFGQRLGHAEAQALVSRAIDPWFNLQAGVRQDFSAGPDRTHLALGIQGLAPYWFEIDAAAFLSTKGELTARIEGEYDQRITSRLILQPRVELNLAAQDVPELRVGAGLSSIEAGLRLRYEFVPEFAPYLGVQHERPMGRTRNLTDDTGGWSFVAGVRAWF